MPTYQYACKACDHRFEAVQAFSDASLTDCPVCDGPLRKVYGSVGVVFKGSGFYRTDSRSGANGSGVSAGSTSDGSHANGKSDSSGSAGSSESAGSTASSGSTGASGSSGSTDGAKNGSSKAGSSGAKAPSGSRTATPANAG